MTDKLQNGTMNSSMDVEMKEELVSEPLLNNFQQADMTDPLPAPQPNSLPPNGFVSATESLPSIAPPPAASTPPVSSALGGRPGSMPPQPSAKPEKPVAHGGPTRQYLNKNLTPHLLEGMKFLAANEPEKPLLWLSEFLAKRSKEIEG